MFNNGCDYVSKEHQTFSSFKETPTGVIFGLTVYSGNKYRFIEVYATFKNLLNTISSFIFITS